MAKTDLVNHPVSHGRRAALRAMGAGLALPLAGCALTGMGGLGPEPGDYASALQQAMKSVTGPLPGYQFKATPVGNFGVGSIYVDELEGADLRQVESNWFLGGPDNWLDPGMKPTERQRWLRGLIAEGSMGGFNLGNAGSRELHAQAGLAIVSALVGNARLDNRAGLDTRLQASEVRQRRLNWAEFEAARRAGRIVPQVADVVRRGHFVLAAADVILIGYRAEISVDESRHPAIAAGLRAKALSLSRVGGSISLDVAEEAHGRFVVTAPQPVVAAVLFKRPPPVGKSLEASGQPLDTDAWPSAAVSDKAVQAVESKVLKRAREPS